MGISAEVALAAANSYTEETVMGAGAIKGKNCIISSITEITGGHRVTFQWTLDNGTVQTDTMDVMDGAGEEWQYTTMPAANADNLNKVIQYIGASCGDLIKGHFYLCVSDGASTPTYSWVDIFSEKTINLHTHTVSSDVNLSTSKVWVPVNSYVPANTSATIKVYPVKNKSFKFMLLSKNSDTSYTIISETDTTADADGTPVIFAIPRHPENVYIGFKANDAGAMKYNSASGNNNKESMASANYDSFVDGTSNSFAINSSTLDFSYDIYIEKSGRVGNVYYPYVVDYTGKGDFTTINEAVRCTRDGDIIYIRKGTYDESVDVRNHPRHFIGESKENTFWVSSSEDYGDCPLNMNDGIVENLTIIAGYGLTPSYEHQRTAYAIHADQKQTTSNAVLEVYNCNLISNVSAAMGIGVRFNQTILIKDCYLESNAEKTWSSGLNDFFNQGAAFIHNDAETHEESSAFLSIENCELKGVKNALALNTTNSGTSLTVRFIKNTLWSSDNGKTNAINIMTAPTGDHFVGDAIDLDEISFGNNIDTINPTLDYSDFTNKPSINGVTLSGNKTTSDLAISYNDLSNKPTLLTGYSTSEQDTGLTWIDGKKIYQKTISDTLPAAPSGSATFSAKSYDIGAATDSVWITEFVARDATAYLMTPYFTNDLSKFLKAYACSNTHSSTPNKVLVNCNNWYGNDCYITVRYTKSTT